MFEDLWDIIEPFPWYVFQFYSIEVVVPLSHYRRVRAALERHVHKYPGESMVLTLDLL